jgi:ribonuclease HI
LEWEPLLAQIVPGKMIHIVTDGDARPNPSAAGWGALIRQNKKCTWFYGHYDCASKNAMEFHAVTEALCILPEGMNAWISTDSGYTKTGITEWMCNWPKSGCRTGKGTPVVNKSLWQALTDAADRHVGIEWSWVKAHSGLLLNEWADMLATGGLFNILRPNGAHQLVVKTDEDTNE